MPPRTKVAPPDKPKQRVHSLLTSSISMTQDLHSLFLTPSAQFPIKGARIFFDVDSDDSRSFSLTRGSESTRRGILDWRGNDWNRNGRRLRLITIRFRGFQPF